MGENAGEGNGLDDVLPTLEFSTFDFTKETWRDDVTFIVEEKRLYASKAILAISSPVFESMFGTDFKEKTVKEVPLPGKKTEDFLEFLNCLYPASERSVTLENVFQVLPLADEYQVESLRSKCKEVLMKSIVDGTIGRREILKCYSLSNRYNLLEIGRLCIEKLPNLHDFEAEEMMDKDTLLRFKTDIIAEQAKRLDAITTQFVMLTVKTSGGNIDGFENAAGIMIEHTIDNVFDPMLKNRVYGKPVKLWNASFSVRISVTNKETRGLSEKYLSVFLHCRLPAKTLTCEVKALIILENVFAVKNKIVTKKTISEQYEATDCSAWGYEDFEKLSKFLTGTPEAIENYTGKLTLYILAKKPKQTHDDSL